MKAFIVSSLERICDWVDIVVIDRLPEKLQVKWHHYPTLLSIYLDARWKTGEWK
jgi:hypothetical protein